MYKILLAAALLLVLLLVLWYFLMAPKDTLGVDGELKVGQSLISANGRHQFVVGPTALSIVSGGKPSWSSQQYQGPAPLKLLMQGDGNLVVYDADNKAIWAYSFVRESGPFIPGSKLKLQDDGRLVFVRPDSSVSPLF